MQNPSYKHVITHPKPVCVVYSRDITKLLTHDLKSFTATPHKSDSLIFPCDIDTEYTQPIINDFLNVGESITPRLNLTVQVKHPLYKPEIFLHPDLKDNPLPNYTPLTLNTLPNWGYFEDFAPIDYLKRLGFNIELSFLESLPEKDTRPKFIFKMYAHFMIADIGSVGGGEYAQLIRQLYLDGKLTMDRRATFQNGDYSALTMCLDPELNLNLEGVDYQVHLQLMDTIGLMGNASLKDLASNTGVKMTSKNLLDDYKTRMDTALLKHPDIFKEYALGDLVTYKICENWQNLVAKVFDSLDVGYLYQQPKLTMGGTVASLIEAKLRDLLQCPPPPNKSEDLFYDKLGLDCTSEHLASLTTGDNIGLHLLAKVGGGRAYNNAPTTSNLSEPCIDLDLGGAYGSVMRQQPFPVGGLPLQLNFKTKTDRPTLRQFLNRWKKEFKQGLWLAVIGLPEGHTLSSGQDYLRSWYPKINKDRVLDPKLGETKYYGKEFFNVQFTSWDLTWLYHDITPKLRNEVLDNALISAAIIYPLSIQVDDIETLKTAQSEKIFKWTFNKKQRVYKARPFYSITMGNLYIDELMAWRAINPKSGTTEQKLLNTLFKLFVNTAYGCSVSPYFKTANVVVGNNITAAVRRGCWCTEKALNSVQSITDGGIFPINRVLKPRLETHTISPNALYRTYAKTGKQLDTNNTSLKPLFGAKTTLIQTNSGLKVSLKDEFKNFSEDEINQVCFDHVKTIFPNDPLFNCESTTLKVSVNDNETPHIEHEVRSGILVYEMKTPVKQTTIHGTANYQLYDYKGDTSIKMRSYTSKQHYAFNLISEMDIELTGDYSTTTTAQFFHNELMNNPEHVKLPPPYLIEKILKPKDFAKTPEKLKKSFPSWNILKVGILRPCTLSQFQFLTSSQRDKWFKSGERLKRKYGYSFELFFINPDQTLNYSKMIKVLDTLIHKGVDNPIKELSNHRSFKYPILNTYSAWLALKLAVSEYQHLTTNEIEESEEDRFNREYQEKMRF